MHGARASKNAGGTGTAIARLPPGIPKPLAQGVGALVVVPIGGDASVEGGEGRRVEGVRAGLVGVGKTLALEKLGEPELGVVDRTLGKGEPVGKEEGLAAQAVGLGGVAGGLGLRQMAARVGELSLTAGKRRASNLKLMGNPTDFGSRMRQSRLLAERLHRRQLPHQLLKMRKRRLFVHIGNLNHGPAPLACQLNALTLPKGEAVRPPLPKTRNAAHATRRIRFRPTKTRVLARKARRCDAY